jgi:hypothetical protein
MTINYPPDKNNNKMEWTIEKALDVVGVGDSKTQIIESYQNSGWAKLRDEFRSWNDESRAPTVPVNNTFLTRGAHSETGLGRYLADFKGTTF